MARGLRTLGAIVAVGLLVALAISSVWPWSVERQMSAYTNNWNDASILRDALDRRGYGTEAILSSPRVLDQESDWNEHVLIILGVERPYTKQELASISHFLEKGGKLFLADDGGYSAPLLRTLAGDVSVNRSRLYSPDYIKNPDFIRASGYIDSGPVVNKKYSLLTDRPAAFQGAISGTPFIYTDNRSWIDGNNNKEKDLDEESGTYILGFFDTGNTFISDPSLFINDMAVRFQNLALALDIINAMLPKGGKVIFDESRHVSSNAGERAQRQVYDAFMFVAFDDYVKGVLVAVCIVAVLVYLRFVRLPTDWYHLPNLDEPWLLNYKEGSLGPSDAFRVRLLLENKVRVARRLSTAEFKLKRNEILEGAIDDPDLLTFLRRWETYKKEDLERVVDKIRDLQLETDGAGGVV